MSSFNARIHQIKIENYHTPPVNEPRFDNPYLLKSDTQALNDILAHLQTPQVAPNQPPSVTPETNSLIPTTVTPAPPTGLTPVAPVTPNPPDPPFQDLDEPGDLEPMPVSGGSNYIPTVTTPHDNAPIPHDDDESGDENLPSNPQDGMNLDEGGLDDEGHSEIVPAQATTTNGSTVSSGPGLVVGGKINSAIGLPESLRTELTSQNGNPLRKVLYNPASGKYTLYYGTRLASSGRYPTKVELSAPPPPVQSPTWYEQAGLAYYQATLDPRSGANYMLDRIANSGNHRNRYAPP